MGGNLVADNDIVQITRNLEEAEEEVIKHKAEEIEKPADENDPLNQSMEIIDNGNDAVEPETVVKGQKVLEQLNIADPPPAEEEQDVSYEKLRARLLLNEASLNSEKARIQILLSEITNLRSENKELQDELLRLQTEKRDSRFGEGVSGSVEDIIRKETEKHRREFKLIVEEKNIIKENLNSIIREHATYKRETDAYINDLKKQNEELLQTVNESKQKHEREGERRIKLLESKIESMELERAAHNKVIADLREILASREGQVRLLTENLRNLEARKPSETEILPISRKQSEDRSSIKSFEKTDKTRGKLPETIKEHEGDLRTRESNTLSREQEKLPVFAENKPNKDVANSRVESTTVGSYINGKETHATDQENPRRHVGSQDISLPPQPLVKVNESRQVPSGTVQSSEHKPPILDEEELKDTNTKIEDASNKKSEKVQEDNKPPVYIPSVVRLHAKKDTKQHPHQHLYKPFAPLNPQPTNDTEESWQSKPNTEVNQASPLDLANQEATPKAENLGQSNEQDEERLPLSEPHSSKQSGQHLSLIHI
eukprot:TRINITY_DN12264_c0_g1_i3.p1 TRINITY_DN12264_c0_g1~~TRINITY_DN12264_c0_g1_i3.p1  ORF type:complete len:545 (+),score=121.65 TRINITY_DN12264_c0_g1_i3:227-1861(+)